ncbi:plasmid maintenance system killer [Deinococcus aerius]|uniref:Plasmid maintenance system killer n=1 Tax=Deinococcus aerius TaxID=200253 RepID=A0A2I9DWV1_9DEIO|nr:type II toxin-antitoxin system RelE/ParE family toxin [Deinococcus aerius]GBF07537.1 plasmid maintenance system killer [Deinococcus aerius]
MKFEFGSAVVKDIYEQGESSRHASAFGPEVVRGLSKAMTAIEAATDERDLRALRSLNYEALKGKRAHQNSLRLNKQWRLIVERRKAEDGTWLLIVDIEDYH